MPTFVAQLKDWTDWDVAAYVLAKSLGIIPEGLNFASDTKYVFWTSNALGDGLRDTLDCLVRTGVLEYRDEPDQQFRVSTDFDWSRSSHTKGR
jgi:hypothetical protein